MATAKITKRSVEAIAAPREGARAYLWDDVLKGFGVMVTPAGARSYLVQYRIGGRGTPTRRYTIGRHGSPWTADTARDRAVDLLQMVRKKIDPVEADRTALQQAVTSRTDAERLAFSRYADDFITRHVEARSLRSADDIKSVFRRDLKPYFGSKSIGVIRRVDIQGCLDRVQARSGSAANKAHKWLRKIFSYAVNRGDLTASPMQGMSPPHQEGRRQRVLRGQELALVWRAASDVGQPWSSLVHLLMLLGQRLREVAGMRWEELDLENSTWVIPGARTKNKRDHLVPLDPVALALLEGLKSGLAEKEGPVLTTNGSTPVSGFSKLKHSLDKKVQELIASPECGTAKLAPLKPWVLHDLRRSVGTGCQSLGFPIEITEAVLNHVSGRRGGLAAIYQLHDYRMEKAAALSAWARHLQCLLSGVEDDNVVAVGRGRP